MGMSSSLRCAWLFVTVLASLSGCSLSGLDRFRFPTCAEGCASLNARDGIDAEAPGTCLAWRCAPDAAPTSYCRFAPRDDDGDLVAGAVCEAVPGVRAGDCDDADPDVRPGGLEACNGADDDCDGHVDEAYLPTATPERLLGTGDDVPDWVEARALPEGGIALAYGGTLDGDRDVAAFERLPLQDADVTAGRRLEPRAPSNMALDVLSFGRAEELETVRGCLDSVQVGSPTPTCETDEDCNTTRGEICATEDVPEGVTARRACSVLVSRSAPPTDTQCTTEVFCDDGLFCNGGGVCEPGDGVADPTHDARDCRTDTDMQRPCVNEGQRCDEDRDVCFDDSVVPTCGVRRAALAWAGEDTWFSPFVSGSETCATLRVGYFADGSVTRSPTEVARYPLRGLTQRGGAFRSTIQAGVDVGLEARCSGVSRPGGSGTGGGVSGVAMASLRRGSAPRLLPQGLLAYRGGAAGESADVEVIGVWLEEALIQGNLLAWVNATGDGVPTRLGVTLPVGVGPSVVSFDPGVPALAGYVLAYPGAGSGVSVHLVRPPVDPAPLCGPDVRTPCLEGSAPYRTRFAYGLGGMDASNDVPSTRRSAPLEVPPATVLFPGEALEGPVQVALGDTVEAGLVLGFAWPSADGLVLAQAVLDPETLQLTARGDLVRIAAAGLAEFSLVHVEAGLGAAEGGHGFVLAWSANDAMRGTSGTYAVRVSEAGAQVAPGVVRLGPATGFPRAYVEGGRLRVLGHDPGVARNDADAAFVAFPGVCGEAPN